MTESNSAGSRVATALAHNSLIPSSSRQDSTGLGVLGQRNLKSHTSGSLFDTVQPHERRKGYLRGAAQK